MTSWFRRRGTHDADASDAVAARDERLSAYLDGELSTSERAALEAELANDASMREALDGMRAVQVALAGLGEMRAPRAFTLNADTFTAPAVRTPRGASRLEWITRLGAVASAAACALLLTTSGAAEFATMGSSLSQTAAERSMAPLAAEPQPAADAAGEAGAGSAASGPAGVPGAPSTANDGAAESTKDSAAPPPTIPQAPASNPLRASTPDPMSGGGAGGGIVTPASTAPAGAALSSAPTAPAASATPTGGGASSAAASAPATEAPTPSAVTAAAPAATPASAAPAQAAPPAAPTSTPALAARPAAPEVTRTSAAAPQPNEVATYGTERDGATSQLEEPSSAGGSATSTGTLAAVLAGLTGMLSVTALGQWIARRRG